MKEKPSATDFAAANRFNDWLDLQYSNQNGDLDVLGCKPRPSEVLHRFSYDTYEASFPDFKEAREEEIREYVTNDFPIIIAHPFYRFLEGAEHEVQKLQFLRDTWEGLVNFLHAAVVSEARCLKMPLADPVKCSLLFGDGYAARMNSVEEILKLAASTGTVLECGKYVNLGVVATIQELNRTRNAFSHSTAVSEDQAQQYISDCLEDVFDVLDAFEPLRNVRLFRYQSMDGGTIKFERFDSHAKTKRFAEIKNMGAVIAAAGPLLTRNQTLIFDGTKLFSARPFLHLIPKTGGHVTEVAFFKKRQGAAPDKKLLFEIVGEAQPLELDCTGFQSEIDQVRALFGLTPE